MAVSVQGCGKRLGFGSEICGDGTALCAACATTPMRLAVAWGWACVHCGVAFKGELRDACPECGHRGKRTVYQHDVLTECEECACAYFERAACPACARRHAEQLAGILQARFHLDWEQFFATLPGFEGWADALEQAKALAQRQRVALMAATENRGAV